MFHSFFPHVLEVAQSDDTKRDSTALGVIRTLSRIDRIFINLPMAEVRDFHCYSHVFENLENRTIPSDHAAVRLVIQKPINRGHHSKRIPSWMSKLPSLCSGFTMTTVFLLIRLVRSQNSKFFLKRLRSRRFVNSHGKTPDSIGAKLFIASTALRAYRNRHLGTLMRCCEAWKPVEDCFDTSSFECIDFQRLSQIIASLTRENLDEREAVVTNLPWTQTQKDTA